MSRVDSLLERSQWHHKGLVAAAVMGSEHVPWPVAAEGAAVASYLAKSMGPANLCPLRFFEETAWRIKAVKLERDRHAQQRHLNPLNVGDLFSALVDSLKGRHRDAILVLGEETLEVFVEGNGSSGSGNSGTADDSNKVRDMFRSLKPSRIRSKFARDNDVQPDAGLEDLSDTDAEADAASEALDGQVFTVGVAFAQILQVEHIDHAITVYYHPNSLNRTQSMRLAEASCWRFTVTLETPEEAAQVAADIESQLAKYAHALQWLRQRFVMDESMHVILVTQGPAQVDLSEAALQEHTQAPLGTSKSPGSRGHVVLQEQPHWETVIDAPASWGQQGKRATADVLRVYLATPLGTCCADITLAAAQQHLKGRSSATFFLKAVAQQQARDATFAALERRKHLLRRFLTEKSQKGASPARRSRSGAVDELPTRIMTASALQLSDMQRSLDQAAAAPSHYSPDAASAATAPVGPSSTASERVAATARAGPAAQPPASAVEPLETSGRQASSALEVAETSSLQGLEDNSSDDSPPLHVRLHCHLERHDLPGRMQELPGESDDDDLEDDGQLQGATRQPGRPVPLPERLHAAAEAQPLAAAGIVGGLLCGLLALLLRTHRQSLLGLLLQLASLAGLAGAAASLLAGAAPAAAPPRPRQPAPTPRRAACFAGACSRYTVTLLRADVSADDVPDMGDSDEVDEDIMASGDLGTSDAQQAVGHQGSLQRWAAAHDISPDQLKRFVTACAGNEREAKQRLQQRAVWMNKNGFEGILQQPQPHYDHVKNAIMHAVLGFSKSDHPVRIMRVGDMRASFKKLKAAGVSSNDALKHFVFLEEYLWEKSDPRPVPLGTAIWIVDLSGMGLADLGSEAFQFNKRMSVEVGTHYPERLHKLVLLNVPGFFSLLWKICEPIMPAATRSKVSVVRTKQELVAAVADEVDASQIPEEYGGMCKAPLYSGELECELSELAHKLTSGRQ